MVTGGPAITDVTGCDHRASVAAAQDATREPSQTRTRPPISIPEASPRWAGATLYVGHDGRRLISITEASPRWGGVEVVYVGDEGVVAPAGPQLASGA